MGRAGGRDMEDIRGFDLKVRLCYGRGGLDVLNEYFYGVFVFVNYFRIMFISMIFKFFKYKDLSFWIFLKSFLYICLKGILNIVKIFENIFKL